MVLTHFYAWNFQASFCPYPPICICKNQPRVRLSVVFWDTPSPQRWAAGDPGRDPGPQVNGVLAIRSRVEERLKEELTPEKVEDSSRPAAELYRWVLAIVYYHNVAKKVPPHTGFYFGFAVGFTHTTPIFVNQSIDGFPANVNDLKPATPPRYYVYRRFAPPPGFIVNHFIPAGVAAIHPIPNQKQALSLRVGLGWRRTMFGRIF